MRDRLDTSNQLFWVIRRWEELVEEAKCTDQGKSRKRRFADLVLGKCLICQGLQAGTVRAVSRRGWGCTGDLCKLGGHIGVLVQYILEMGVGIQQFLMHTLFYYASRIACTSSYC